MYPPQQVVFTMPSNNQNLKKRNRPNFQNRSNHLHNSLNDNQLNVNLNSSFQRMSKFKIKSNRRNQRSIENHSSFQKTQVEKQTIDCNQLELNENLSVNQLYISSAQKLPAGTGQLVNGFCTNDKFSSNNANHNLNTINYGSHHSLNNNLLKENCFIDNKQNIDESIIKKIEKTDGLSSSLSLDYKTESFSKKTENIINDDYNNCRNLKKQNKSNFIVNHNQQNNFNKKISFQNYTNKLVQNSNFINHFASVNNNGNNQKDQNLYKMNKTNSLSSKALDDINYKQLISSNNSKLVNKNQVNSIKNQKSNSFIVNDYKDTLNNSYNKSRHHFNSENLSDVSNTLNSDDSNRQNCTNSFNRSQKTDFKKLIDKTEYIDCELKDSKNKILDKFLNSNGDIKLTRNLSKNEDSINLKSSNNEVNESNNYKEINNKNQFKNEYQTVKNNQISFHANELKKDQSDQLSASNNSTTNSINSKFLFGIETQYTENDTSTDDDQNSTLSSLNNKVTPHFNNIENKEHFRFNRQYFNNYNVQKMNDTNYNNSNNFIHKNVKYQSNMSENKKKNCYSKYSQTNIRQNFQNKQSNSHYNTSSFSSYPKLINSYHDIISTQIWNLFLLNRQTPELYERKIFLRETLYKVLRNYFAHDLFIVGSSLNGLGTNSSDVDMCLVLPNQVGEIDQYSQAIPILKIVSSHIESLDFVTNIKLIEAKVPILKFFDKIGKIEIDLNINNIVGIRNTQLVKCYTRLDWRVQPLAIAIKAWAIRNDINNAHKKTISSYTLVLMLIHYLQVGCEPACLPCLHKLMPTSFQTDSNVKLLNLYEDLPDFRSMNEQTLGELFLGFLNYYGFRFDYLADVISVRQGSIIKKEVAKEFRSSKNTPTQWRFMCCEEPFDRTNTARSVSDLESFARIIKVFQESFQQLKHTQNLISILKLENLLSQN